MRYLHRYYSEDDFRRRFGVGRDDFNVNRRLLNQNQVLAADYFVRRLKAFLKYVGTRKEVLGGTLKDYVIRYETQGRGSVHAHILWWVDVDKELIRPEDQLNIDPDVLARFGLVKTNQVTQKQEQLFDNVLLAYTNANVWALRDVTSIREKLSVEDPNPDQYVSNSSSVLCC